MYWGVGVLVAVFVIKVNFAFRNNPSSMLGGINRCLFSKYRGKKDRGQISWADVMP